MEEKESTFSGSLGNSDTDSPPPNNSFNHTAFSSPAVNTAVNVTSETTLVGPTAPAPPQPTAPTSQVLAAANTGVGVQGNVDLSGKKKRGRPRKYDADGNLRPGQTHNSGHVIHVPPPPGFYLSPGSPSPSEFSAKKGRGRPAGSGNWQVLASLETAGGDFTPHVVTVGTGEDVAGRILSFSEKGPRGICILSANGAVSNVTIRQPGSSGGILTYEGRFELLSLSGSFTVTEIGGVRSRTGGLSVSLAGPDGRVIGGGIAGMLTAASPIQIVVGSFMPNGCKPQKKKHYRETTVASPISGAPDTVTAATPISQAQPEIETRFTPIVSLAAQIHEEAEKGLSQNQNFNFIPTSASILMPTNAGWNATELKSDHRPSPDINVSVPGN
ncbi:AT-hook motif nuclear-localized protein 1-like [Rosa rugosa]|uniref:AT-hook motif nuclear-localized protein 1-like n=1 Tax=Rosa rugosa TaxID=74645 RepID=UPI002B40E21F|nr:AT-hook motif nuclear-localized protein 1-like [Rosa rugosa]